MNKWEKLLDQKPVPLLQHLLSQAAELFATDLMRWPPSLEDVDEQTAQLLATSPLPPSLALYEAAFELARFELERRYDALDDYLRNERWLSGELGVKNKPMLLFLSRFITEQLLGLSQATDGRVARVDLLATLEGMKRHFMARRRMS